MTKLVRTCALFVITVSPYEVAVRAAPPDNPCTQGLTHQEFIRSSKERIANGEERRAVLDTLQCIALSSIPDRDFFWEKGIAVRAIFAIADEAEARKRLVQMLGNPDSARGLHPTICELLIIVANDPLREELARLLFDSWNPTAPSPADGRWQAIMTFFEEAGGEQVMPWLEQMRSNTSVASRFITNYIEASDGYIHRIRMVGQSDKLIEYFQSTNQSKLRSWALRQALRCSPNPALVRETLLAILSDMQKGELQGPISARELVPEADRLQLLPAEAGPLVEEVRTMNATRRGCGARITMSLPWIDEIIDERYRTFFSYRDP